MSFVFVNGSESKPDCDARVVNLPADLCSQEELTRCLARLLSFPAAAALDWLIVPICGKRG